MDLHRRRSPRAQQDRVPGPVHNGRVKNNTAFRQDVTSNDTEVNEFLGYLQVDLWPDVATFYVDENLNGGATNREVFGLLRGILPWDTYVKAGRMFPAFGLRVLGRRGVHPLTERLHVPEPRRGRRDRRRARPVLLRLDGDQRADGDKDVQATVNAYAVIQDVPVLKNLMGGASFARQSDKRNVAAVYGGSNLWRFTYLGEVDFIHDHQVSTVGRRDQLAAYAEVNLLLLDWLNLPRHVRLRQGVERPGSDALRDRGRAVHQPRDPAPHPVPDQQRRPDPARGEHGRAVSSYTCSSEALYFEASTTRPCTPPCETFVPSTVTVSAAFSRSCAYGFGLSWSSSSR